MVLKDLRKSTRKTKKYMITLYHHKTGKKIRDIKKRTAYYKRHNKSFGRYSADALSKKYLWGK